jgi:hypothetical protein
MNGASVEVTRGVHTMDKCEYALIANLNRLF